MAYYSPYINGWNNPLIPYIQQVARVFGLCSTERYIAWKWLGPLVGSLCKWSFTKTYWLLGVIQNSSNG